MLQVRAPAVAGLFYPADAAALRHDILTLLNDNPAPEALHGSVPKALVVPHAGYVYSGPVAACAYNLISAAMGYRRVVLAGPAHRVPVRGIVVAAVDRFRTPLGDIPVDAEAVKRVLELPQVRADNRPHAPEHSLEVHLPFLQMRLGNFSLLPLVVGEATPDEVAEVFETVWNGEETLMVISSDLSHYLPYDLARALDDATRHAILGLDHGAISHNHACGATPLWGLLASARRHGLTAHLADLRNSGDTAGDRSRVVGYGAFVLVEGAERAVQPPPATATERATVLRELARAAIAARLGRGAPPEAAADWLNTPAATFVTLRLEGELRGCMGTLNPFRSLFEDVCANARAAAFDDPRFTPLTADEFRRAAVEVSELSALEAIPFGTEAEAVDALRPGVDGVVLSCGALRGTFLPQVWKTFPQPRDFLGALKRKAGLPADFWSPGVALHRFTVARHTEKGDTP
ncbi:MAG: AmmeMemoRadiSam system protein B [Nitrospirae bacterium]|nr:AmmeMemoRadiSam system protein B [Nitrospirota bacterium]